MSTVAEFTILADEFALGRILERLPQATVELERVVPTGTGVVPYFWVSGADRETIESAFEEVRAITAIQIVDSIDDQHLIRAEWNDESTGILRCIADSGVTLLSGSGTATDWTFEVRAQRREEIATFQDRCKRDGISIAVVAVQTLSANQVTQRYGLTMAQREALTLAYEYGYFDDRRGATLDEIAADLSISRQALAARLRRGHRNLIRHTIVRSGTGG
ncbi:MAG: bacterio-opsin activator domain-containing protein [Halorientalis sp.]